MSLPLQRRLVLALDAPDKEAALDLYRRTQSVVGVYKVGLELFIAEGPALVRRLTKGGAEVFLDLKLHDIPNTVRGAVRAAAKLGVSYLTLHALNGPDAIKAAREALSEQTTIPGGSSLKLLAVTILTHHNDSELASLGIEGDSREAVLRLVTMAQEAGADGCVCSPEEAAAVREACGPGFLICTPGVRPTGAPLGDQARTATPADAIRAGADLLVVGRPIRTAPDPAVAATEILVEVERALAGDGE
jgi:orotidine-5'-phosphate decarboxylase